MEPYHVFTPEIPWNDQGGYPEGIEIKTLRDDSACGARTLLVRILPNGELRAHAHRGVVQRYILEERCEVDGEEFPTGSYSLLPRHANIPRTTSKDGATLLLIYEAVVP